MHFLTLFVFYGLVTKKNFITHLHVPICNDCQFISDNKNDYRRHKPFKSLNIPNVTEYTTEKLYFE